MYLNGLEGAAEQHVVRGDQRAHGVVMSTDSVDFLQSLDVPNLTHNRKRTTQHIKKEWCRDVVFLCWTLKASSPWSNGISTCDFGLLQEIIQQDNLH